MDNKIINLELEKLKNIKEMIYRLINIPNKENYNIKELREIYYDNNPDVFQNLINAYNHINEYTDNNEKLVGYNVITESFEGSKYRLINAILDDFVRGRYSGANHTIEGEKAEEEDIYLRLNFEQYVSVDIVSIKEIKEKWLLYTIEEQEKIKKIAKNKFDARVWVLLEAVNEAIDFTQKDKEEFEVNKQCNNGDDIDI